MENVNLQWGSDNQTLVINGVTFVVTYDVKEYKNAKSTENRFIIIKARSLIEDIFTFGTKHQIKKILEIGIFQGGSVVLHDQLFGLKKNVAIDYAPDPIEALTDYICQHGKQECIKPYYGVDQSDAAVVENILAAEFPSQDIDLIIDDASHMYKKTRVSFNACFPYLKSGGHFIIEDWGWAHWEGEHWQKRPWQFWKRPAFYGTKALSNLLVEIFMLSASRPDLISQVSVNRNNIIITKGSTVIQPGTFDMADHYFLRGKRFRAWI